MGGKTNTTTQQSTYAPSAQAQQSLQSILGLASATAATPYQPFTGAMVAGLSPTQQSGIANTNAAVGTAQPYINQAAQYASNAAGAITPGQISNYENPYQQDVINSTIANINETNGQQQQQVLGNAAMQGALGGNRVGVASAELARQQGLASGATLAGLNANNYTQALGAAQADRAAQGQAAYTYGSLGGEAQNAALQAANAQIGAGGLEQQTSQAGLSAAYQQYLQQMAYPYQQAQFLAGIGIPAAGALGGTTQGTTTSPGPNIFSQLAGLGVAGAGLFMGSPTGVASGLSSAFGGTGYAPSGATTGNYFPANPYAQGATPSYTPGYGYAPTYYRAGGRVNGYADGGAPYGAPNFMDTQGFIPRVQISGGQVHQPALMQTSHTAPANPYADLIKQLGGMKGKLSGVFGSSDNGYDDGGFVSAVRHIRRGLKGYDDGGPVASDFTQLTAPPDFDSRWQEVQDAAPMFNRPASVSSPLPVIDADAAGLGKPVDWTNAALQADAGFSSPAVQRVSLSPDDGQSDGTALGYADDRKTYGGFKGVTDGENTDPFAPPPSPGMPPGAPPQTLFGSPLTDERRALIAAGLGIMGGTSPFALTNIGQGALQGIRSLDTSRTQAQKDRQVDIEAKRLAEQAQQFAQNYGLKESELKQNYGLKEEQLAQQKAFRDVPVGYRKTDNGIEPIPGGPQDPAMVQKLTKAKLAATSLSDPATEIAARQIVGGDLSALTNVGRGAQGDAKLTAIKNRGAEILIEQGMSPAEAASYMSNQLQSFKAAGIGKGAEARTAGTREANLNIILKATDAAIPAALEASEKVARTGWVPLNKIIQQGQVIASNPELKEFGMANLQLAEHWARAMNPTGVMRESDRDKALSFLSTADSAETYKRAAMQLRTQISRERDAVASQREPVPGGRAPSENAPAQSNIPPATVRQNGHTYQKQPDGSYKAID